MKLNHLNAESLQTFYLLRLQPCWKLFHTLHIHSWQEAVVEWLAVAFHNSCFTWQTACWSTENYAQWVWWFPVQADSRKGCVCQLKAENAFS